MASLKFMTGKPALLAGKDLIVADLHLGIELEFYKSGIKFPSQTDRILRRIDGLLKIARPDRLVLLGDVKHKVPGVSMQEMREVPEFLRHLTEKGKGKLRVEIVPGNHDPGIDKLAPARVRIHPSTGTSLGNSVYLCHGHAWPGPGALKHEHIVIGHQHPLVEFRDKLGYRFKEPVWVRGKLDPGKVRKRYKRVPARMPEIIVMPSFNGLSGGFPVNRKALAGKENRFISPLTKAVDEDSARLYLLDGTYIGKLPDLQKRL